ncbi:MAG: hypothetical protein HZA36_01280 [Parcubacteria group bacterium]|nr:hypothetical protein [Parcubacteria group bacterium]
MEEENPVLIHLEDCVVVQLLAESYSRRTYEVRKQDLPNDIYNVLGIDETRFRVLVEAERPVSHYFGNVRIEKSFVFRPGIKICLYIEERKDRNASYISGFVYVLMPGVTCIPEKIGFQRPALSCLGSHMAMFTLSFDCSSCNIYVSCFPRIAEVIFGLSFHEDGTIECLQKAFSSNVPMLLFARYASDTEIDFSLKSLFDLKGNIDNATNVRNCMLQLMGREGMTGASTFDSQGIKKILGKLLHFYEMLLNKNEVFFLATFHSFVSETKRTINGVKVAGLFNQYFQEVGDYESFKKKLEVVYTIFNEIEGARKSYDRYNFEELFVKIPGYMELRKDAIRSQSGRALTKMVQDVDSYDHHVFAKPVAFTPCTKKDTQNVLGYFELSEVVELRHTEHRARVIPAGKYELRQCRSWEANPKGIWTLRID